MLCRLLAGYITHPNVAGATVLSLGCQNAQIEDLQTALKEKDSQFAKPVFFLEQQKSKSERDFIRRGGQKNLRWSDASQSNQSPTCPPQCLEAGAGMWRLRRIFRAFCQSGSRLCLGPAGGLKWNGHPIRISRTQWRRARVAQPLHHGTDSQKNLPN